MSKLQLPSVTLICTDCLNANRAIKVLEHCKSLCDFGAVKFLTSIPVEYEHRVKIMPLNSLIAYSIFMLTRFHEYIETEHCLIVQRDGFILNPESWDDEWLSLDYIAPLFVQYSHCGSGGFSLRSKKLMQAAAERTPKWDGTNQDAHRIQNDLNYYEDGVLSLSGKFKDFKIASLEQAGRFAAGGNKDPRYFYEKPFGFHGLINSIDHATGIVKPVCEHGGSSCDCVAEHRNHLFEMEKEIQ